MPIKVEDLHKVRVYPEDIKKPGTPDNLVVEIDGMPVKGIAEFSYEAKPGQLPTVSFKIAANISLDMHSTITKTDTKTDQVSF